MSRWLFIILAVSLITQPSNPLLDNFKSILQFFYKTAINAVELPIGLVRFLLDTLNFNQGELRDSDVRNGSEYDFIVIGAGTAGSIVAARLSEDKDVKVLLIDAGHRENLILDIPLVATYLLFHGPWNWHYLTEADPKFGWAMKNNQLNYARGKLAGGSSAINFMMAVRGNPEDYNFWAKMGNKGWSFNDVLPYFKKLENVSVKYEDSDVRGHNGPVDIVNPPYQTEIGRAFIEAGEELGFPVRDYNGKKQISFSPIQANMRNAERVTSNRAYLRPVKGRNNLVLTRDSYVHKIIIDPSTLSATGVLYEKNSKTIQVNARKEIILAAGAINSPQILMLSGIGPSEHLEELNITTLKDLKVGDNFFDHLAVLSNIITVNSSEIIDVTEYFLNPSNLETQKYFNHRKGTPSIPGAIEAIAFIDSKNLSNTNGIPDIEIFMDSASITMDPLFYKSINIKKEVWERNFGPYKNQNSKLLCPVLLQPKSRGKVRLNLKDPKGMPRIMPNYYSEREDVTTHIRGIRAANKLIETNAMKKYNATIIPIIDCISYGKYDSDEYWECVLRTFPFILWHISGTCKMGPEGDETAVVDPRLKVHGIQRLRVADTSIMPYIPRGHTNLPAMMIGEKAADMIKEDHNLKNTI